jgi:leader peptidase (prepilin peptidase)/N-methyltransferase
MTWTQILLGLAGLLAGCLAFLFYRKMPTPWLLDYDETEISASLLAAQQAPVWPDAALLALAGGVIALTGPARLGWTIGLLVFWLAAWVLLVILIADWKTRIIPDPLVLALILLALAAAVSDFLTQDQQPITLLWRFLAGLGAALLFLLIGWIGGRLAGQEAMGMGDIKLIAACVWLTGPSAALPLFFLSFLLASVFAFPLLIQKYWALARQKPEPDGAIAFGPFIALATLVVTLARPELNRIWQSYLELLQ